jgi:predicted nucleotidyltransferase
MEHTSYPHVNVLLDDSIPQMQQILAGKLVGLYLYGSLVTGDFDDGISDIDLLVAMSGDMAEAEFHALKKMHDDLITKYPAWDNRIEIAYLSLHGLKTFKTETSKLGIISPGEPFHIIDAGIDWLMNWHVVREKGRVLLGPPPDTIIEPTSKEEYVQAVKAYIADWRERINQELDRPYQAYAILTMCRGLYTSKHGEQVSKRQAALWATKELPEWSALIQSALLWRERSREEGVDHRATLPETRQFVHLMIDRIFDNEHGQTTSS